MTTTFKILKQTLVVQIIITIIANGIEARQSMQSYNGANGNLICGGDNRKRVVKCKLLTLWLLTYHLILTITQLTRG